MNPASFKSSLSRFAMGISVTEFLYGLFVAALFSVWIISFSSCTEEKALRVLPVYGPVDENEKVNHRVSNFSLISQDGKTITQKDFDDKIFVADFFFTTCPSICPRMTGQMQRVYEKFNDNADVMFLSHTVNPEKDTPAVLAEYAKKHNASSSKWIFATGDKKQIYDLARNSYLVDASQGDGGDDDFVHTQNFALVDKDKRIRGYYDGTDEKEVDKLIAEINVLLKEYE